MQKRLSGQEDRTDVYGTDRKDNIQIIITTDVAKSFPNTKSQKGQKDMSPLLFILDHSFLSTLKHRGKVRPEDLNITAPHTEPSYLCLDGT